jgi:hypothetical protein
LCERHPLSGRAKALHTHTCNMGIIFTHVVNERDKLKDIELYTAISFENDTHHC